MRDLSIYYDLCKVDILLNNMKSKFPYDIKDNIYYTQHELVLNYKKNYCKNIMILEDSKDVKDGGNIDECTLTMITYQD